jgi:hypothetical protein
LTVTLSPAFPRLKRGQRPVSMQDSPGCECSHLTATNVAWMCQHNSTQLELI